MGDKSLTRLRKASSERVCHRRKLPPGTMGSGWTTCLCMSLWTSGLLLCIGSGVVMIFGQSIWQPDMLEQQVLVEGTQGYQRWLTAPYNGSQPRLFKVHVFNLTNPDANFSTTKPLLQEVGPFTYRMETLKEGMFWDDSDFTVNYQPTTTYKFLPDSSVSAEPDQTWVNLPNLPYLSAGQDPNHEPFDHFVNVSVGGFLWGYDLGTDVNSCRRLVSNKNCKGCSACEWGFFKGRNATRGDHVEIYTGEGHCILKGVIKRFKGSQMLNTWNKDSYCDNVTYSLNGFETAPKLCPECNLPHVQVFLSDYCHKITLRRPDKPTMMGGIEIKRFKQADVVFYMGVPDHLRNTPPQKVNFDELDCHCMKNDGYDCYGQKMFNLGPCRQKWIGLRGGMKGLVMSKPHFLGAKDLQEKVSGLSPQEDLHITYLDIEPKLGITTGYKFRYQMNVVVGESESDNKLVLPLFWVEEGFDGPNTELADEITQAMTCSDPGAVLRAALIALTFGTTLTLIALIICIKKECETGRLTHV